MLGSELVRLGGMNPESETKTWARMQFFSFGLGGIL
jgi:hypothetical protein